MDSELFDSPHFEFSVSLSLFISPSISIFLYLYLPLSLSLSPSISISHYLYLPLSLSLSQCASISFQFGGEIVIICEQVVGCNRFGHAVAQDRYEKSVSHQSYAGSAMQ
jgi:hypothetical protein